MGKDSYLNRKKMIKEEALEYQEGRQVELAITLANTIGSPPLLSLIEAKFVTLSDVVLNIHRGIFEKITLQIGQGK